MLSWNAFFIDPYGIGFHQKVEERDGGRPKGAGPYEEPIPTMPLAGS